MIRGATGKCALLRAMRKDAQLFRSNAELGTGVLVYLGCHAEQSFTMLLDD